MRFYIIDAFTEKVFGGNPAGVVILPEGSDFPPEEVMRKTAAELRYSETAFIRKKPEGGFRFRYFTPTEEVDLCGHATIASYFALLEEGLVEEGLSYQTVTLAGDIRVSVEKGFVLMDMAPPRALGVIRGKEAISELYGVMGLPGTIRGSLYPEIISTGLPDILLPVADRDALYSMQPDFKALAALSERYGVVGVHAFSLGEGMAGRKDVRKTDSAGLKAAEAASDAAAAAAPFFSGGETPAPCGEPVTAYCRNFAPAVGIDEEAATGTSNGALTYYLYKNALIEGGMDCVYLQGEAMNRPSRILGRLSSAGDQVRIGGSAAILARGEIDLS